MTAVLDHQLTAEETFCLEGCRSYPQYYQMRRGFEAGTCVFCTLDHDLNRPAFEDDHFLVWHIHPKLMRAELRLHILIVPKRHVRFMADLTAEEWRSLALAVAFANRHFGYTGGLFHVREGDMRKNAGTVPHLHINLFEPNGTGEVRVPVYKDPGDRTDNETRAARYALLYTHEVTPERFTELVAEGLYNQDGTPVHD